MQRFGPTPLRRRLIALTLLALWASPGASALAAGVHLALDHHHHHPHGARAHHETAAAELALAVVHGHRHDLEAVPDHEHAAPAAGAPGLPVGWPAAADPPLVPACETEPGAARDLSPFARPGPPVPIYHRLCSLLL